MCNTFFTEDVTITNITNTTAVVGWTVASISSEQQYYVEYGDDEDTLDQRSDTITVSDVTLIDQEYDVTLTGLTSGVLYYLKVTAEIGDITISSDTTSFRTLESGNWLFIKKMNIHKYISVHST